VLSRVADDVWKAPNTIRHCGLGIETWVLKNSGHGETPTFCQIRNPGLGCLQNWSILGLLFCMKYTVFNIT